MGSTRSHRWIRILFVVVLSAVFPIAGGTASAATASDADAQFECGVATCSFVFSRAATNDIATGGAASAACAAVPTPGNIACGIGFAALAVTANSAKNRNACAKITWTTVPAPPLGTWWPSVDGSSRCT
jgi:hypothetical protein